MLTTGAHVVWKGRSAVHAIRPARHAYETAYAGMTWCGLYGEYAKSLMRTDAPLTCKTCVNREADRASA